MINAEIIIHVVGQILLCGRVTGNKEFTVGGLKSKRMNSRLSLLNYTMYLAIIYSKRVRGWQPSRVLIESNNGTCLLQNKPSRGGIRDNI